MIRFQAGGAARNLSAPRVCGDDPTPAGHTSIASEVLPAYAGMILEFTIRNREKKSAPRVCGDDPNPSIEYWSESSCSPRMRG